MQSFWQNAWLDQFWLEPKSFSKQIRNFREGSNHIDVGWKRLWSGWMKGAVVDCQCVSSLEILVTEIAVVAEHASEVDRLNMVSNQAASGSLEVFANWAGVSPWHLGALANKLVQLLWVLQVLILWNKGLSFLLDSIGLRKWRDKVLCTILFQCSFPSLQIWATELDFYAFPISGPPGLSW